MVIKIEAQGCYEIEIINGDSVILKRVGQEKIRLDLKRDPDVTIVL